MFRSSGSQLVETDMHRPGNNELRTSPWWWRHRAHRTGRAFRIRKINSARREIKRDGAASQVGLMHGYMDMCSSRCCDGIVFPTLAGWGAAKTRQETEPHRATVVTKLLERHWRRGRGGVCGERCVLALRVGEAVGRAEDHARVGPARLHRLIARVMQRVSARPAAHTKARHL